MEAASEDGLPSAQGVAAAPLAYYHLHRVSDCSDPCMPLSRGAVHRGSAPGGLASGPSGRAAAAPQQPASGGRPCQLARWIWHRRGRLGCAAPAVGAAAVAVISRRQPPLLPRVAQVLRRRWEQRQRRHLRAGSCSALAGRCLLRQLLHCQPACAGRCDGCAVCCAARDGQWAGAGPARGGVCGGQPGAAQQRLSAHPAAKPHPLSAPLAALPWLAV